MAYPVLLIHGMGFKDSRIFNYWGRVPKLLERMDFKVFYGWQDSNGSVENNGKFIAERIQQIVTETGCEKVNIIAHSKGGLDARYAISTLGMGKYTATLTTLSTPHNGSLTMDWLMKAPDTLVRIVAKCTDLWLKLWGDRSPDSYSVFHSLTTAEAERFNKANPDCDTVRYKSYAFVMKNPFSDMFLWFSNLLVSYFEGENDGLLAPRAVRWGEFMGVQRSSSRRGISHCDEVDMRRLKFSNKKGEGISDILELYKEIAESLP